MDIIFGAVSKEERDAEIRQQERALANEETEKMSRSSNSVDEKV